MYIDCVPKNSWVFLTGGRVGKEPHAEMPMDIS